MLQKCSRGARQPGVIGSPDLKHLLDRPSEHIKQFSARLEAVLESTEEDNPDAEFLKEAIETMGGLQRFIELRTFQAAMGQGPFARWEWHNLLTWEYVNTLPREQVRRQS